MRSSIRPKKAGQLPQTTHEKKGKSNSAVGLKKPEVFFDFFPNQYLSTWLTDVSVNSMLKNTSNHGTFYSLTTRITFKTELRLNRRPAMTEEKTERKSEQKLKKASVFATWK